MLKTADYSRWLLDNLITSVIVVDQEQRLIFMNSAAEGLFALSFRQAREMSIDEVIDSSSCLMQALRCCLQDGRPRTERELVLVLPGPRPITVDCTLSPLGNGERPDEVLLEFQQIDRQLRISREEHLLAQHQTSRALVRNLAHEIKNPLGGLRGAAQLLEREFTGPALKEYTGIIIGEADRLRSLVDRMLGPTSRPVCRDINIHEVLERVRQLIQAEAAPGIVIQQDYDPSIPPVYGDFDQLIQALLNITRNAVEALQGQGSILFRSRIQRQCTIGHSRHRLVARIEVIDNGPGISDELREDIFYPMISGRSDGTGLGLSIAQSLINQHGGLIEYTSRPGETVFSLLIPLMRKLHDC